MFVGFFVYLFVCFLEGVCFFVFSFVSWGFFLVLVDFVCLGFFIGVGFGFLGEIVCCSWLVEDDFFGFICLFLFCFFVFNLFSCGSGDISPELRARKN